MSGSVAAVVQGFERLDPKVHVAGVFLNKVAGERHLAWLKESLKAHTRAKYIGHLFFDAKLQIVERHLGLVPAAEQPLTPAWMTAMDRQLRKQVAWPSLLRIARSAPALPTISKPVFPSRVRVRTAIAVAQDAAFCFYYRDNLDLLEAYGAEILPFSPMKDALPRGAKGLYLGGGYPELWGKELAANRPLRSHLTKLAASGFPIYGECGGLMYLGKSLRDQKGRTHAMAGVLPHETVMTKKMKLAYVHVTLKQETLLSNKGMHFPAHIFHFSEIRSGGKIPWAYRLNDGHSQLADGLARRNTLASYCHVHFASKPSLAKRFVDLCAEK
jgi:cobyrinic acid a,c-diamide synthase